MNQGYIISRIQWLETQVRLKLIEKGFYSKFDEHSFGGYTILIQEHEIFDYNITLSYYINTFMPEKTAERCFGYLSSALKSLSLHEFDFWKNKNIRVLININEVSSNKNEKQKINELYTKEFDIVIT